MIWMLILSLIISTVACYFLFAPFYLEINSMKGIYEIRFHYLASAGINFTDSSLIIYYTIAGWRRQIDPRNLSGKKVDSQKKNSGNNRKLSFSFQTILRLLKSFNIKKCYVNLDTGDVQWNGILYPIFYGLSKQSRKTFAINFAGNTDVILEVDNNLARILRVFFFHF